MAINAGIKYEKHVRSVVHAAAKKIGSPDFQFMAVKSGAFDANAADMSLKIRGQRYGFEIKYDGRAPMGRPGSFKYDGHTFRLSGEEKIATEDSMDDATKELMLDAVRTKKEQVDDFVRFIRFFPPTDYHKAITGLPIMCTVEAWETAVEKGLLKNLNLTVVRDTKIITDHYAKKGTYYIQIGKSGLFYMQKNPLNLPIPQLVGKVDVEIRMKRRGAEERKTLGIRITRGSFDASARLHISSRATSLFSLDKEEDVIQLFGSKGSSKSK